MHCPDLVNIFKEIKNYSKYTSDTEIAQRLGIDRSNIRHYLQGHANAPYIPAKRHDDFREFFAEILSVPVSLDSTKTLLSGDADTFHSLISPVAGKAWARLIRLAEQSPPLQIRTRKSTGTAFSIGVSSHILTQPADTEIRIGDHFILEAQLPLNGQAVIFVESVGKWEILGFTKDTPIIPVSGRTSTFPPQSDEGVAFFEEMGPAGFYRYLVIGMRGKFSDTLHDHLLSAQPLTQAKLDLIGDMLMYAEAQCTVLSATLLVKGAD